jgi:hypothetical protein
MASNLPPDSKPILATIVIVFSALAGWMFSLEQRKADRSDAMDRWTKSMHVEYAQHINHIHDDLRFDMRRLSDRFDRHETAFIQHEISQNIRKECK